jgi:oxygen-independent coproporphyrinogen III oxidase
LRPALYLHIPYCRLRCTYCNFYFELGRADERLVPALEGELELRAGELPAGPLPAIYLGGGTPSWLPAELLSDLLKRLERFVGPQTEFSIECNPEDVSADLLALLALRGVNRVSLGVQSLNDLELKRSARRHNADGARRAMDLLQESGISWSADLIIGLPQQTRETFRASLEEVLTRAPEHLSLYTLELDSHVPLVDVFARRPEWDPGDALRADLYHWAHDRLAAKGFIHYEVSNWALPDRQCRYNQQVWRGEDYLGIGPSAHSHIAGRRFSWPADIGAWINPLLAGRLPEALEDVRSARERDLESLLLALRGREGLPLDNPLLASSGPFLEAARKEGWIEEDPARLRLSPSGWLRLDGILARLST